MEIHKTYRYRVYPTDAQKEQLKHTFGCSRYVYNWALDMRTEAYHSDGESVGYYETKKRLTKLKKREDHDWLYNVSSVALQESVRNLEQVFTNFFEGRAEYPSFKSKGSGQVAHYLKNAFTLSGDREKRPEVKLAKQSQPLDIRWSRDLGGEVKKLCVTKDASGRYHICFTCTVEVASGELPRAGSSVGVDLGLSDVIVTSGGYESGNPKHYHSDQKRLAKAQRRLSRKEEGSENWKKQKKRVASIHAEIEDKRQDFIHKLTTRLVKNHDVICVESLAVKNMQQNRCLASHIADASWGNLVRQLRYKCKWHGRTLVEVDRWFPSSKRCHVCGHTRGELSLGEREWTCKECGCVHDRDKNAAENLKQVGTAGLAGKRAAGGQRKTSPTKVT